MHCPIIIVTDSGKGVCVDPGEREAILGTGGARPLRKGIGQQLAPDREEKGRSSMDTETGDGLTTISRDGYAQSEHYCALYSNCIV
jgi:hypothetical protein